MKKGGNFDHGCKKNRALLDFFCNLVSRFGLILIRILFSIEWTEFQGASFIINRVMVIFSPQPLKKWIFVEFFVKVTPPPPPPPRKSQNIKMRNFCNGFYKMMMSTFKKSQNLKFEGISS